MPLLDYLCTNAQINIGQRWPESLWPSFLDSIRTIVLEKLQVVGHLSHPSHLSTNGGVPGFLKNGVTHDPKIHCEILVMFHGETHIGFGVPILRNHQIEGSKINLWQKVLDKIKRGDEPDYAHLHEFVSHP